MSESFDPILSAILSETSSEHENCKICKFIREKTSNGSWCFEWLRHLKDFEASQIIADKDRQVLLMVDHTNNEVKHIRSRLAILQTQMPAWTIINTIKETSELKAIEIKNIMETEHLKKMSEKIVDPNHNAHSEERRGELGKQEKLLEIKEKLKDYVRKHIVFMLSMLYSNIQDEEKKLERLKDLLHPSTTKAEELFLTNDRHDIELEKKWYLTLYDKLIVGPVGERPLHICCLSAFRFENVDFEGTGNYLSEGIVLGMLDYIFNSRDWSGCGQVTRLVGPCSHDSNICNEITAQYGKDYCAAVGKLLLQNRDHTWGDRLGSSGEKKCPPFWRQICKWKKAHLANNSSVLRCCWLNGLQRFAKMQVSVGLYEGETILLPLIMGKAAEAIHTLLEKEPSLLQLPVNGLFFHPLHWRSLTSLSAFKGWKFYFGVLYRNINMESSSKRSYLGLNALYNAVSQGDVAIFDQIFYKVELALEREKKKFFQDLVIEEMDKKEYLRIGLLGVQDMYGNTMLHVAAWNENTAIYDRLVQLGADATISNSDGLTPFTLTARLGIWKSFNHIWENHLTQTLWQFGNTKRQKSNYMSLDWRGIKTFVTFLEAQSCFNALIDVYSQHQSGFEKLVESLSNSEHPSKGNEEFHNLIYKYRIVKQKVKEWQKTQACKRIKCKIEDWLKGVGKCSGNFEDDDEFDEFGDDVFGDKNPEHRSAIRMITLFRPEGWYVNTREILEEIILHKWSAGYYLVHLGQNMLPYCLVLIMFGLMWSNRQLHVLQHNFWWATPLANAGLNDLSPDHVLKNPIVANISELLRPAEASVTGTSTFQSGQVPHQLFGIESTCGWRAIRDSTSGHLQAILGIYGVACLLRLAYTQRRVRPTDWDENEDMMITADETIHFIYLNLEMFLNIIMSVLFVTIAVARVAAGEECTDYFVQLEKVSTAIAALFLFLNLLAVCKPYEGIGLLLLATYKFLISDVFNFLIMYLMLFAGFLLAIQTVHNADQVYLAWLDSTSTIYPHVRAVTDGAAYLINSNLPEGAERLQSTHMNINGCSKVNRPIYATAMMLLEISLGDGLAEALGQVQQSDYECAGFPPDPLLTYILIFWVFLTNVLILNMLIAMMNYTFDRQKKAVHSVWLLDVSYRIMRYERLFPELTDRMQTRRVPYSVFRLKFWKQLALDICLVFYCLPELHIRGMTHAICTNASRVFTKIREGVMLHMYRQCSNAEKSKSDDYNHTVTVENVIQKVKEAMIQNSNEELKAARERAGLKKDPSNKTCCLGKIDKLDKAVNRIKGTLPEQKLKALSMLPDTIHEVRSWIRVCELQASSKISGQLKSAMSHAGSALHSYVLPVKTCHLAQPDYAQASLLHASSIGPEEMNRMGTSRFEVDAALGYLISAHPEANQPMQPPQRIDTPLATFVQPQKVYGQSEPVPLSDTGMPVEPAAISAGTSLKTNDPCRTDQPQPVLEIEKMLLLVSLICRLDMIQQDYTEACTVFKNHVGSTQHSATSKDGGAACSKSTDDCKDEG